MLVSAVPEETYCYKSQNHSPARVGNNLVCYRCGMLLGSSEAPALGSLLDY